MDQEIASLKLNINQLAGITNVHRQTVAARLKNVEPAPGSNSKLKLYLVTDILTELMVPTVSATVDDMQPSDRLAHWKAENERIKFEQETGQLIPAEQVAREFAVMSKAVVQVLETLPDILERDCALSPAAVARVQSVIDDLRDQIAQRVLDAEPEEDQPEED
ncbi:DUF1441 family protein [Atlantibacter hermannii]|nr:DUF1441 family protein [Atlantibacter hermannii]KIU35060.1 terminase [Atlantibacter hermannii]MCQ4966171.1 DUF1441 family protein [Enterobacteriaceae bacterium DFI.7.85]QPS94014.1 DUF1441 family protein [Atlantibacter hermannii]VDZ73114.1 bacteriophage DNA packaging protein; terminase, small subunit [Atlantibacter hermannii]